MVSVLDGVEPGEGREVKSSPRLAGVVTLRSNGIGETLPHGGGHPAVEERLIDGVDERDGVTGDSEERREIDRKVRAWIGTAKSLNSFFIVPLFLV